MSNSSTFSKLDLALRSDFSKGITISRKMEDDDHWSWRRANCKITAANAHVLRNEQFQQDFGRTTLLAGLDDHSKLGIMIGHFKWPLLGPELLNQNQSLGGRNNREKAPPSGFKLWKLSINQHSLSKIYLYNFMLKFLLVPARRQYL